jgi:hypothetical protein
MDYKNNKRCRIIGTYIFCLSKKSNKKYDVFRKSTQEYITSFGAKNYQVFKDPIGLLPKHLIHGSQERKRLYYARHGKDAIFESPKYFSHRFLW